MFRNPFKKAPAPASSPAGEAGEYNPLDGVRVEAGEVIFNDPVNDDEPLHDDVAPEGRVREAVCRLYSDEKFHGHIVRGLGWIGRKKGYDSLQIDHADEGFRAACEVVYRRLSDGPAGRLLDRISDQALEDLIIIAVGFGPVAKGFLTEQRQKKRGTVPVRNSSDTENTDEGESDER